ncbi:MAG: glycosyltransferase family 4 protein [Anaerolineales bacterium]
MESHLPLTVALLSHSTYTAGAERMLLNLALLLRRVPGIEPILFIPGIGELAQEARAESLRYELAPQCPWYVYGEQDDPEYPESANAARLTLHDLLLGTNADVLVVNTLTSIVPGLVALELDLPFLLWVHGVLDSYLIPNGNATHRLLHDRLLLELARVVVCPSQWTGRWLEGMVSRDRVHVLPNWTQVEAAPPIESPGGGRKIFVCANTFDHHKGHATLLRATAILRDKGSDFEVHLFGEGTHKEEMVEMASNLGLRDIVRFKGRTTAIRTMYDSSFCVINPSFIEPFGMTLIEGMARRLPVIACKAGGPEEIVVEGETGFLVDPGDAPALADRMARLLNNPDKAQVMGERGYERAMRCYSEEAASRAFPGLVLSAVSDFSGYSRTSKLIGEMYDLYLSAGGPKPGVARRSPEETPDSAQEASDMARPPRGYARVGGGVTYRVSPQGNNWAGIDVLASVLRGPTAGALTLQLFSQRKVLLRQSTVDLLSAMGDIWLRFDFPPISNSRGIEFLLSFSQARPMRRHVVVIREDNALEARYWRMLRRLGIALRGNQLYCHLRYRI